MKKTVVLLSINFLVFSFSFAQRPNIIYIMTDDMGYADLSSYGRKDYQTPQIDKLASQGMKFLHAYAAAPICTPTRTAFMTGRYPARTPVGLIEPLTGDKIDSAFGLTAEYPSIATLMKNAGYETALIGKWHLGFNPQNSPVRNGYDYFFGFHSGAVDYISHKGYGRKHDLFENENPVHPEGYMTDLINQKASAFIKQEHKKPFFLTINFNAPHWPWQGPADRPYEDSVDFRAGGSAAVYAAMMKSLDDGVGKIMQTLDEAGLAGETLVIFTNDNGGERYSDNGRFTGAKGSLWEGGIRVPAFVRWPGKINAGTTTEQVATTMDWTKTILSAGGGKADPGFPLDGINLMPILTKELKPIDRTLYWRVFQRQQQKALRDGNWKYLQDEKGEYLFNLQTDPEEKQDLKTREKEIFNRLRKKYAAWELTVLKPVPL